MKAFHYLKLGKKERAKREKIVSYILISLAAVFFIVPLFWMIITSLKSPEDIATATFFPTHLNFENFKTVFESLPFLQYTFNSLYYAVAATIGTAISVTLTSYAFAKLKWPGRDKWFLVMIGTMIIPTQVLQIPLYILYDAFGWIDTYNPLIIPLYFAVGGAANVFLMRQFFMGIPDSLRESAKLDGANEFQIFGTLMLPLMRSTIVVISIMSFMNAWNDFYNPLLYINDSNLYPLAYAVRTFASQFANQTHLIMAASLIVTLPSLILFFIAQKQIIGSTAHVGVKG